MEDALCIGEKLPGNLYVVVQKIGSSVDSVFSQVYIVKHRHSGSRYIFKVNMTDDEVLASCTKDGKVSPTVESIIENMNYRKRVINEIRALKYLNKESHHHICTYHDHIKFGNRIGLLLDKVTACETLGERLRREEKRLETYKDHFDSAESLFKSISEGLDISEQLADALNFLVSKGYLHKDVKPGNIVIDGFNKIRLIDFGMACPVSKPNRLWGTRVYSPPERYLGIEHRFSDLWSGALIANELIYKRNILGENSDEVEKNVRKLNDDPKAKEEFELKNGKLGLLIETLEEQTAKEIAELNGLFDADRELLNADFRIMKSECIGYFLQRLKPIYNWIHENLNINPEQRNPRYKNTIAERTNNFFSYFVLKKTAISIKNELDEKRKKIESMIEELKHLKGEEYNAQVKRIKAERIKMENELNKLKNLGI